MMNRIPGMEEAFTNARVVYLTTFSNGEEHSRQMTNFNEDPYKTFWFPTYTDTRKVEDLKENPRVLVTFPAEESGQFYEIEGKAELADREFVKDNWSWWYLYWHPEQRDRFWFPRQGEHPERAIILIHPESAKLVRD
jgi:general stress protein 26